MAGIKVYSKDRGARLLKEGVTLAQYREKHPDAIQIKSLPTQKTMEKWCNDGVAKTPCGCRVEPDGRCPHGRDSWLLILGLI